MEKQHNEIEKAVVSEEDVNKVAKYVKDDKVAERVVKITDVAKQVAEVPKKDVKYVVKYVKDVK